jgi:hypothetical protein
MQLSRQTLETAIEHLKSSAAILRENIELWESGRITQAYPRYTVEQRKQDLEKVTTAIEEIESALKEDTQP